MSAKQKARIRRSKKTRHQISLSNRPRLSVFRSSKHIYAQIFSNENNQVITACSTVEQAIRSQVKYTGNKEAANLVGKILAQRAIEKKVSDVAFDRSGFLYHGRIKELSNAARENGLKF